MSTVTDEEATRNIAANVTRLLREQEMSQRDLSHSADVPEMSVSRIVRGLNQPGIGTLTRVAQSLGVTVDELVAAPKKNSRRTA
jgi:transcriptional regulator with XRE-family HTH domain